MTQEYQNLEDNDHFKDPSITCHTCHQNTTHQAKTAHWQPPPKTHITPPYSYTKDTIKIFCTQKCLKTFLKTKEGQHYKEG